MTAKKRKRRRGGEGRGGKTSGASSPPPLSLKPLSNANASPGAKEASSSGCHCPQHSSPAWLPLSIPLESGPVLGEGRRKRETRGQQ